MILAFVVFLVVHGLIHLMGFAKAFGYAELPQLTQPISPRMGLLWLLAAVLFLAATLAVIVWPRGWWGIGVVAILVSTAVIVPSWSDAKFGMVANAIAVVGVVFGVLANGPGSLRAAYDRDVATARADVSPGPVVGERDLLAVPPPVRRYLRSAGVVGQPRVTAFQVRMHGRIRSAPDASWMPFVAEQHNVVGTHPARLFYMTATRAMVPVQGYHRFVGRTASMRIEAAALVPVVDLSGEEMARSETVTLFNDMCIMAPSTLLDPGVTWVDTTPSSRHTASRDADMGEERVRARFTNAGRTIEAVLVFEASTGALVDFVSDDRSATSADGTRMQRQRWSTPLRTYRAFGPVRLASAGEGRWHDGDRSWTYIELELDEVRYR